MLVLIYDPALDFGPFCTYFSYLSIVCHGTGTVQDRLPPSTSAQYAKRVADSMCCCTRVVDSRVCDWK